MNHIARTSRSPCHAVIYMVRHIFTQNPFHHASFRYEPYCPMTPCSVSPCEPCYHMNHIIPNEMYRGNQIGLYSIMSSVDHVIYLLYPITPWITWWSVYHVALWIMLPHQPCCQMSYVTPSFIPMLDPYRHKSYYHMNHIAFWSMLSHESSYPMNYIPPWSASFHDSRRR